MAFDLYNLTEASEVAGLTRAEFIEALSRFQVPPFQYTAEELAEDLVSA